MAGNAPHACKETVKLLTPETTTKRSYMMTEAGSSDEKTLRTGPFHGSFRFPRRVPVAYVSCSGCLNTGGPIENKIRLLPCSWSD